MDLSYSFQSARVLPCLRAVMAVGPGDVRIDAGKDGWRIAAMSPDHVMMASAHVHVAVFDAYSEGSFSVSVEDLAGAVARMPECSLSVTGGVMSARGSGLTLRRPLACEAAPPRIPEMSMDAHATLQSDPVRNLLSATSRDPKESVMGVSLAGGMAAFTVLDGSDDPSPFGDELAMGASEWEGEAESSYPMRCFAAALKAVPKGGDMTVSMGTDYPLEVRFGDGASEAGVLVAPRIRSV